MSANHFYVYLLLTRPVTSRSRLNLNNVLYVGKGHGYRWVDHFKEIGKSRSAKVDALRAVLGPNPDSKKIERHAVIVAGDLTQDDAFRLESIMLQLARGVKTTNVVSGHDEPTVLIPAHDARVFFGAEDLLLDAWLVSGDGPKQSELLRHPPDGPVLFMVKGTANELNGPVWEKTSKPGRFANSLRMKERKAEQEHRRGWDPHNPWTSDEAISRARRFWSAAPTTIDLWQKLIADRGGQLALLVPDPRDKRSVIRYVWSLDATATWEDYGDRFGFPMGNPIDDHRWLGRRPVDRTTLRGFLRSPTAPGLTIVAGRSPRDRSSVHSTPATHA